MHVHGGIVHSELALLVCMCACAVCIRVTCGLKGCQSVILAISHSHE